MYSVEYLMAPHFSVINSNFRIILKAHRQCCGGYPWEFHIGSVQELGLRVQWNQESLTIAETWLFLTNYRVLHRILHLFPILTFLLLFLQMLLLYFIYGVFHLSRLKKLLFNLKHYKESVSCCL